jgi:hypothetical protein
MNRDFSEMLSALCGAGAEFLVVGASHGPTVKSSAFESAVP